MKRLRPCAAFSFFLDASRVIWQFKIIGGIPPPAFYPHPTLTCEVPMAFIKQKRPLRLLLCLFLALSLLPQSWAQAAAPAPLKSKTGGMVLSSHILATNIGQKVLDTGGNAVDAAVAVGYALAVVHPAAGNIGGGGFAVIHTVDGQDIVADFREKAPLKATKDMYLDKAGNVVPQASTVGYLAAGTPGTVAGMSAILAKYGTRKLSDLITPAIELADKGFRINTRQEVTMAPMQKVFAKFASSRKYFLKPDGSAYKEGELFVQKDLAATLRLIAGQGPDAFYKGRIANQIDADMKKNGGLVSKEDLAKYSVAWRAPVKGTYRGYEIVSMSPPSSGGTHIIQILNVMEQADIKGMGFASSAALHITAEAMRYAFADRSEYMGDPDFVKVPADKLIDKAYAKAIYDKILKNKDKATPSKDVKPGLDIREGTQTTHYSVVDKKGNAVAVTYTINTSYGSGAAVMGAGFLLNNEMDDFAIKPGVPNVYGLIGSTANEIAPEKRPLSSMSPTIVLKDGKIFMVVGSPGGSRIITTTLQTISNVIDHGMNISEAVMAPRVHMQWVPDELRVEKYGVVKDVADKLAAMGYKVSVQDPMGDVNALLVDQKSGIVYGSTDPRAEF